MLNKDVLLFVLLTDTHFQHITKKHTFSILNIGKKYRSLSVLANWHGKSCVLQPIEEEAKAQGLKSMK